MIIKRARQILIKQQAFNNQGKPHSQNLVKAMITSTQTILNQTQLNLMMLIKQLITLIILMIKMKTSEI